MHNSTNKSNRKEKMSAPAKGTIVLDVLRVASTEVLGQTKPLSVVAPPFTQGNAKGDLKSVDSLQHIEKIALASAAEFRQNLLAAK
jgi:hypothetical protein